MAKLHSEYGGFGGFLVCCMVVVILSVTRRETVRKLSWLALCATTAFLAWLYVVKSAFWLQLVNRAADLTIHSTYSTSFAAIVRDLLVAAFVLARILQKQGGAAVWQRLREGRDALAALVFAFIATFLYHLLFTVPREIRQPTDNLTVPRILPVPPTLAYEHSRHIKKRGLSLREVSEFGSGIAVQIVKLTQPNPAAPPKYTPEATAFWVDRRGYVVSCLSALEGIQQPLVAAVPMPPLLGTSIIVQGGGTYTAAKIVALDLESDLAILRVTGSPFTRQVHGMAIATNTQTGKTEKSVEYYTVPSISPALAHTGDIAVRVTFSSDPELPIVNPDFTHVTRAGVDTSKPKKSFRLYTSLLPFKPSDCGAPLLNEHKALIGVVGAADVAIPSQYVIDLVHKSLK